MKRKKGGGTAAVIFVILIALAAVLIALTEFFTDWLWFAEMGYVSVFFTEIKAKLVLGLPAFVLTSLLAVIFLGILKRNFLKKNDFELNDKNRRRMNGVIWLIALVFGIIFAVIVIDNLWFEILKVLQAGSFGKADPIFGKDVSFYVFKLEFLTGLSQLGLQFALLLLGITVVFYLILLSYSGRKQPQYSSAAPEDQDDGVEFEYDDHNLGLAENPDFFNFDSDRIKEKMRGLGGGRNGGNFKAKMKALFGIASGEIIVIGVLFFIAAAVRFLLMQYSLLYGGTGVAYGAGCTDMTVSLNIYRAVTACSLISAVMLIVAVKRKKLVPALIFPAIMVLLIFIQAPLVQLFQNYVVSTDEINKEREYIDYNIEYTRAAYDLADISVRDFEPDSTLGKEAVLNNMETFSNIRINDFEPAEQFYNQTQSIRSYYTFNDVDVDRYYVNGEYTQVFLAAREIDQTRVEDNWLIRHLKYTHGYGVTLSRVDKVTSSGQPDMLIDSIPPVSEVPEISIRRPEIYYGESTSEYVIVGSSEQEFDYPSGESNVYCEYEGEGGIALSPINKLLFAIRERSLKLLVSTNIDSGSRIMIYRDIMQRARKIAPFLEYDNSPYLVVSNEGRLFWIIDAYTSSQYYPYSEPYSAYSDVNYIRNSVKIVVDAYNGSTDFYIADAADPIVNTFARIYPALFKSFDEMPADLRTHIQYPNALFEIQASVYRKYHMTNAEVFYQSEDLWAIAKELYGQTETQLTPINFIMKLPGESRAEFISSIPYTPNGKSNMTGLLIARSDGENYGELVLYRLPKYRIIYGPAQIEAQINQDAEISKEFSLWNNSGATYSRGNLFVFPVENSLFYVEPIYMESSSSSLPEVKRVVMYYGDKVAYESTLAACLDALFGEGTGAPLLTAFPIEAGHEMAARFANGGIEPSDDDLRDISLPESPGDGDNADIKEELKELIKAVGELLKKMEEYLNDL